jgi:signal transduction histidine kinase
MRWLQRSLAWKLILGFGVVALVGVGTVALLANAAASREVRGFMFGNEMTDSARLAYELAAYYQGRGDWSGVQDYLQSSELSQFQPGMGRGPGMRHHMAPGFVLTDDGGQITFSNTTPAPGRLRPEALQDATPIMVEGETVGYLLLGDPDVPSAESQLLARVNRAVWLAAILAGAAALLLGGLLAMRLLRPLRELTSAAQDLAAGDLSRRVQFQNEDEVGELASAFNRMAKSLQEAETRRREMTADIAHELRNPLAIIKARVEALVDGVHPPTEENLASVLSQSELLNRLVEDLRTLAQADAGKLELDKAKVSPADLSVRVISAYQAQAKQVGVPLHFRNELNDDPTLTLDPARMEQVLGNLLSNALHHSPPGEAVQMVLRKSESPPALLWEVKDNGEGIPPEALPHIFDRFYRADSARTRRDGGSGLGLAIARKLVQAHGGALEAENRTRGGALFRVSLPLDPA